MGRMERTGLGVRHERTDPEGMEVNGEPRGCVWVTLRAQWRVRHYPHIRPCLTLLPIPSPPVLIPLTQEKIPWEGEFTIRSDPRAPIERM